MVKGKISGAPFLCILGSLSVRQFLLVFGFGFSIALSLEGYSGHTAAAKAALLPCLISMCSIFICPNNGGQCLRFFCSSLVKLTNMSVPEKSGIQRRKVQLLHKY